MNESEVAGVVLEKLEDRPQKVKDVSERMTILQHDRNPTVRLERHLMASALWGLRQEMSATSKRARERLGLDGHPYLPSDEQTDVFHQLKREIDTLRLSLDILNQQSLSPDHVTSINTNLPEGNHLAVPFLELDIAKPPEREPDSRIPWIGIGGVASDYEQNFALWMALALEGERVFVPSYPEKIAEKPEDWNSLIKKYGEGTFQLHQDIFSQAIQGLSEQKGFSTANLIGHSVGGELVIGLAAQPEPPVEIHHLVSVDPVGFEDKNIVRSSIDFAIRQNLRTASDTEDTIKMLEQGKDKLPVSLLDFYKLGKLSGQRVITPSILKQVQTSGEFQVYVGSSSPIVSADKVKEVLDESTVDGKAPAKMISITDADHAFPVTHAIGFMALLRSNLESGADPQQKIVESELETSAVQAVLNQMKAQ